MLPNVHILSGWRASSVPTFLFHKCSKSPVRGRVQNTSLNFYFFSPIRSCPQSSLSFIYTLSQASRKTPNTNCDMDENLYLAIGKWVITQHLHSNQWAFESSNLIQAQKKWCYSHHSVAFLAPMWLSWGRRQVNKIQAGCTEIQTVPAGMARWFRLPILKFAL